MIINKIHLVAIVCFGLFSLNSYSQESEKINEVLTKKRAYNKDNPEGMGFKIQLYNGNESQAYKVKNEYQLEFEETAELSYESPEWKVRVGNFTTRLEADKALLEIKKKFTGAIVLETEIKL